jgi:hypothetical protein
MKKIPITESALIKRLNRHLAKQDQQLRKGRPPFNSDLGEFYIVDLRNNFVSSSNHDLENLGRQEGALAEYEVVL